MNPTSNQADLHLKMRQFRDFSGYSQKDVADALEIAQSSYYKIEKGQTNITVRHLEAFSEFMGIAPGDFFTCAFEDLAPRIIKKCPLLTQQMRN